MITQLYLSVGSRERAFLKSSYQRNASSTKLCEVRRKRPVDYLNTKLFVGFYGRAEQGERAFAKGRVPFRTQPEESAGSTKLCEVQRKRPALLYHIFSPLAIPNPNIILYNSRRNGEFAKRRALLSPYQYNKDCGAIRSLCLSFKFLSGNPPSSTCSLCRRGRPLRPPKPCDSDNRRLRS